MWEIIKMFIPQNEPGVFYMFSRIHEELGFDEIVDISTMTPDIFARRNGELVGLELEYKSSGALRHYRVSNEDPREGKWLKEGKKWKFILNNGNINKEVEDPHDKYRLDVQRGLLLFKSVRDKFSIIVCWENNELFEENIEVIELENIFK